MSQTRKRTATGIDIDAVRQLAAVLGDAGLTEVEYESGDVRIRLAKTPPAVAAASWVTPPTAPPPAASDAAVSAAEAWANHPGLLTSPMVGIVYLSPEPTAAPFVTVGDAVALGDTVLLIEAMKVFNPIKAHRAGRIERIFVSAGVPVEYGEPLLLID